MLPRLFAAIAFFLAGLVAPAAADDNLVPLGSATLDMAGNGVAFDITKFPGAYKGIRVRAKSGRALISTVRIVYANSAFHLEERPISLEKGERTRPVDEGDSRFIDTVFITPAPNSSGKAVVEVLGIQTAAGAKMKRPKQPATGDLSAGPASATPGTPAPGTADGNDVLFGYQNVGFAIDRDIIKVGGDLGKFKRIRLRVLGNDVHINALKVIYIDGETSDLAIDADVKANTKTGWLDLKPDRFIRELEVSYRSRPNFKGQARVEVTGQYADDWLGPNGEGRKFNQGWVLLGAQTAGFTGFDRDTITVGKNEGGFSRLKIEAKERAITLREVRVKYFSGPDEVFSMNERVDPGKPFGPLEFKGGKTPIKAIEAKYRSRFDLLKGLKSVLSSQPAVVQIWGQH